MSDVLSAYTGRRVLITGGGGFVARHLAASLIEAGAEVERVGRSPEHEPLHGCSPLRVCSVGSAAFRDWFETADAFDYAFHLAATTSATGSVLAPLDDFQANLATTISLLDALRRGRPSTRLVLISSASVYGNPPRLPIHEADPTVPVSPYGLSKLAAEQYAALFARLYGLSAASVRPFSVYGPGQTKQVVYSLMRDLRRDGPSLTILGDGSQVRDLVYVDDVVRGMLVVGARGRCDGTAYNIATGVGTTLTDLAHAIAALRGRVIHVAYSGASRVGDQNSLLGDNSALAAIGGAPRWSLGEGLRATLAWFDSTFDSAHLLAGARP